MSGPWPGRETRTRTREAQNRLDARERLIPDSALLDLHADPAPDAPVGARKWPVVGVRMPPHVKRWIEEQAQAEGATANAWINRLLVRERDGGLPGDCRVWLARMAAQLDMPGDADAALVIVLRHLADRYPNGARLR